MMKNDFCVVIPAYNEEKHIEGVIDAVMRVTSDIIIVDDGSKDRTGALARKKKAKVLTHKKNLGKGAALRTGCDYAAERGYKKIILMDSDGQHQAREIEKFVKLLERYDIVFSYRTGGSQPFILWFGNLGLALLSFILSGKYLRDPQSGYRAFRASAYERIRWKTDDYSVENEIIFRARRLRYKEIPIKMIYHDKKKGTGVIDGLRIGWHMIRWKVIGR